MKSTIGLSLAFLMTVLAACGGGAPATPPASANASAAPASSAAAPASGAAAKPSASAAAGGELIFGKDQEAPGLDPAKNPASAAIRVFDLMYSRLVRLDTSMRPQPDLAEKWDQPDAKTYVFHLRHGVKFHNGRELTSDDVKYTYERILDPKTASIAKSFFAVIDKIETPDKYTVKISLKEPFAPFLVNTASTWAGIVAKEVVEANKGDLNKVDAGSGPFKLQEWTPQTRTVLVKNPDYYIKGQPKLDKITFQIMPEESARIAALRTGNIQFTVLTAAGMDTLKNDQNVKTVEGPTLSYDYLGMNVAKKPFDNVLVRQAVSYAMDRKELIDTVYHGHAKMTGPVPAGLADFALDVSKIAAYKPDLNKAKQLLTQAGLGSGFKTTIMAMAERPTQVEGAQVVQSDLKKIGIDATVQPMEVGLYVDTWKKKGMEMMIGGNGAGTNPDRAVCFFFCTDGTANVWNYSDKAVDQAATAARAATDAAKAKQLYDGAQTKIVDEAPNLFLANPDQFLAYSPKVQGFAPMPDETWQGLITTSLGR